MANNADWYAIEEDFWCPCEDKLTSCLFSNNEHVPDCLAFKHKILFKVSDSMEYEPAEGIPQREKGRNSVVDEFLANLETLNNTRRRSSSKLLPPGFVLNEEMSPSLTSKSQGLQVYLPACFSPTKFEKLSTSLDKNTFEFTAKDSVESISRNAIRINDISSDEGLHKSYIGSAEGKNGPVDDGMGVEHLTSLEEKQRSKETSKLQETTDKFSQFSLVETGSRVLSSQRNLTERLRRSTLNKKFSSLRESIPDIADNSNISKVNILKTAVKYIKKLEQEEKIYSHLKANEKAKNKTLLKKLIEFNSNS